MGTIMCWAVAQRIILHFGVWKALSCFAWGTTSTPLSISSYLRRALLVEAKGPFPATSCFPSVSWVASGLITSSRWGQTPHPLWLPCNCISDCLEPGFYSRQNVGGNSNMKNCGTFCYRTIKDTNQKILFMPSQTKARAEREVHILCVRNDSGRVENPEAFPCQVARLLCSLFLQVLFGAKEAGSLEWKAVEMI